jgi:putative cardiolipin synthase
MLSPVGSKALALHAKALTIDHDKVFIGSANLDPRSLRLNTEMGLLIESEPLNAAVRNALAPDFDTANAWRLQFDDDGRVVWVSGDQKLTAQPAISFMQRIEDWFFSHLPIEDEL